MWTEPGARATLTADVGRDRLGGPDGPAHRRLTGLGGPDRGPEDPHRGRGRPLRLERMGQLEHAELAPLAAAPGAAAPARPAGRHRHARVERAADPEPRA